jgi:PAS domain S-box-containing protein
MGFQQRAADDSSLQGSQRLLLVIVALALAAYAASTWFARHMWERVNSTTDRFASESVYKLRRIAEARDALSKAEALLRREAQNPDDPQLKREVERLRAELDADREGIEGGSERVDLEAVSDQLREVEGELDHIQLAVVDDDRAGAKEIIATRLEPSVRVAEGELRAAEALTQRQAADFVEQLRHLRARASSAQRIFDLVDGSFTLMVGLFAVRALRAGARVERVVRRQAAKFEGVIATAPDAIISIDDDRRIVLFNVGAERIFGWSRDEATGKPFDMLVSERLRDDYRSRFDEQMRGEASPGPFGTRSDLVGLRRGGEEFSVEGAFSILRTDGPALATIVLRDVTERKRAEEALRVSEERFHALVDASAEIVWTVDREGLAIEESPSWCAFTGQSHEQYKGTGWLDAVHPDDRERVTERWKAATREKRPFYMEYGVRHVSGEWRWASERAVPLFCGDGTVREWIGMNSDISEARRIASEQRFLGKLEPLLDSTFDYRERLTILARLLALYAGDFCYVWIAESADRPPVHKVFHAYADPAKTHLCERLEQLALERPQGAAWRGSERMRAIVVTRLTAQHLESATLSEEHHRLLRELGPESMMILPIVVHGRLLSTVLVFSSDRHRRLDTGDLHFGEEIVARAALSIENAQLYETARQAVQARDDVLRIVAHDLRSPISAIQLGAGQLMLRPSELGDGTRSVLQRILRSSERATRLIEDLLEVTRIEAGTLVIDHHAVAAEDIVRDVVEAHRPVVSASSLELQVDVADGLPAVWVDRDGLEQVFGNLIGNAVKFTRAGGRVTIGATPTKGGAVQFWVSDTGVGFDSETREHLFDRFWQARRGARHGVGLGLSIVKSIVEAHGGQVAVDSAPGNGSTFSFTVPAATA